MCMYYFDLTCKWFCYHCMQWQQNLLHLRLKYFISTLVKVSAWYHSLHREHSSHLVPGTHGHSWVKQHPLLISKVILTPSSEYKLLVLRKTGGGSDGKWETGISPRSPPQNSQNATSFWMPTLLAASAHSVLRARMGLAAYSTSFPGFSFSPHRDGASCRPTPGRPQCQRSEFVGRYSPVNNVLGGHYSPVNNILGGDTIHLGGGHYSRGDIIHSDNGTDKEHHPGIAEKQWRKTSA